MAELVVACFDNQFEANAAAEKLISIGVQREQIVLTMDESIGNVPSSSSAPTTVVSDVSHTGSFDTSTGQEKKKHRLPELRVPRQVPDPKLIGHTTVVVELHGEMSMDEACQLLENAGARSTDKVERKFRAEKPSMWPAIGHASQEDVQRSIDASRHGAALKTHRGS